MHVIPLPLLYRDCLLSKLSKTNQIILATVHVFQVLPSLSNQLPQKEAMPFVI